MKVSDQQPASDEDRIDDCERQMREYLRTARRCFQMAKWHFDSLDNDLAEKLWFRFGSTERRLMKNEDKDWS